MKKMVLNLEKDHTPNRTDIPREMKLINEDLLQRAPPGSQGQQTGTALSFCERNFVCSGQKSAEGCRTGEAVNVRQDIKVQEIPKRGAEKNAKVRG